MGVPTSGVVKIQLVLENSPDSKPATCMSAPLTSDRTRLCRRPRLASAQSAGTAAMVPVQLHDQLPALSTFSCAQSTCTSDHLILIRGCLCRRPRLVSAQSPGTAAVVPMQLQELDCLSSVRIYIPKDMRPPDARQLALKVSECNSLHMCAGPVPELHRETCEPTRSLWMASYTSS